MTRHPAARHTLLARARQHRSDKAHEGEGGGTGTTGGSTQEARVNPGEEGGGLREGRGTPGEREGARLILDEVHELAGVGVRGRGEELAVRVEVYDLCAQGDGLSGGGLHTRAPKAL